MTERGSNTDAAGFRKKPTFSPIIALPYSEAYRPNSLPEPITLSPVGEHIHLHNDAIVERPNPLIMAHFQAADPRVRYFSTDRDTFMIDIEPMRLHHRAVSRKIGFRVREDFPDEEIFVRGTVATLTEPSTFPYWNRDNWMPGSQTLLPLNPVSKRLASGTDDGGNYVVTGNIDYSGKMNDDPTDFLSIHYGLIADKYEKDQVNQIFPVLLVYKRDAFVENPNYGGGKLTGKPHERIAALYITDRIVLPEH